MVIAPIRFTKEIKDSIRIEAGAPQARHSLAQGRKPWVRGEKMVEPQRGGTAIVYLRDSSHALSEPYWYYPAVSRRGKLHRPSQARSAAERETRFWQLRRFWQFRLTPQLPGRTIPSSLTPLGPLV